MATIKVRKGMPSVGLTREEFTKRLWTKFHDPEFEPLKPEIDKIIATAWKNYREYRKNPRTIRAGDGFADPNYQLAIE